MRAAIYHKFQGPIEIATVDDPEPTSSGVVIQVGATGLCRSDWHGWQGHDADITLPHVPGHELAGTVVEVGKEVAQWQVGDRVTVPFVCGCGSCGECITGNHQVCDFQFQPGFTHWGAFAELVAIDYADTNLVHLPEEMQFSTAASLGCRFVTSFRAVVDQGQVSADQWVAVHGCGGVGLSAIMIANAIGARVVAIDIDDEKLALARSIGASLTINASSMTEVGNYVKSITNGGVHVSIDALGSPVTCTNSIQSLKKRGKHIQVGLLLGEQSTPNIPMADVIANELEIIGSHGIQAFRYSAVFDMIRSGALKPELLIGDKITLDEVVTRLPEMNRFNGSGVTIVDQF